MYTRRGRWLPLQTVMWLLIAVATVSMVITLHLGDSFTWLRSTSHAKANELLPELNIDKKIREHLLVPTSIRNAKISRIAQGLSSQFVSLELKFTPLHSQRGNGETSSEKKNITANFKFSKSSRRRNVYMSTTDSQSKINYDDHNKHQPTESFQSGDNSQFIREASIAKFKEMISSSGISPDEMHTKRILDSVHGIHSNDHHPFQAKQTEFSSSKDLPRSSAMDAFLKFFQENQHLGLHFSNYDPSTVETLYNKILQIEKASLIAPNVLVKGSLSSVKQHLPLIEAAFHKFKTKVTYETDSNDSNKIGRPGGANQCIVICLNNTSNEDNCVISAQQSVHQRVNTITEVLTVINSPKLMCHLKEDRLSGDATGKWYGGGLPCYSAESTDVAKNNKCDSQAGWWVVSENNKDVSRQFLSCGELPIQVANSNHRTNESILVSLPNNLLTLDGMSPLVWQVEVLVMSLLPPRVYLHPAGIAWSNLHEFIHRKHQKNVSLYELRQLITERDNESTASVTLIRLESVIMDFVRLLENHVTSIRDKQRFCQKCFQLLAVVLVFDSSFQPIILEVNPSFYSEHLSSLSDYLLEQNILEDLAAMLVPTETTSVDILQALLNLGVTHSQDEKICSGKESICFGELEITYLLDTRREQRATKNWIRLFPSSTFACISSRSLNAKFGLSQKPVGPLEKFALSVEEYFLCPFKSVGKTTKLNTDIHVPLHTELNHTDSNNGKYSSISKLLTSTCDYDNSSFPYLSAIQTYPYIQLFPEFSPLNTEYRAYTDYQTILVHIRGVPKHCEAQAKLEDKHSSRSWSAFSLGLGENAAHILVVGVDHLQPYVFNIYKVVIYRRKAGQGLDKFDLHKGQHKVCSLKQDCSLPLFSNVSCGLQPVSHMISWNEYLNHRFTLPPCRTESLTGEWMVPCSDCRNELSCYWHKALWQTPGCQERQLENEELKRCFTGKKVLFIGDSTNRGILHYILERLNGSLYQWNKTHNTCIYPDLNDGETVFGFTYYPQFWLMSKERPMFDKALSELLNRTAEWSDKDTVMVIGGVHWLAKHHLDMIANQSQRKGLHNYKVIVKGLGAGFHQPATDVHQLSLVEQQRLSSHNQAVLSHARSLGFLTVDTFSMTMARYKDFLQGKCACHFHQVSPVQPSVAAKLLWNSSLAADHSTRYHVEGDINSVYSEMVINRICTSNGG